MGKVVFAEFSTMDFAELAARNVRQKFEGISKIKIKYRYQQNDGYNDMEYVISPQNTTSGWNFTNNYPQLFTATYHLGTEENFGHRLESSIHVYADEAVADRIAGYLRAAGGLSVKISEEKAE